MEESILYREKSWQDLTWVGFDTETTGQYPLSAEFCEVAAIKWRGGQVVDTFQSLVRPQHTIPDEVIKIHGITNEMVVNAPEFQEVLPGLLDFFADGVVLAHHAPFDVGFLMVEIEKMNLPQPKNPIICSSLLSRKVIKKTPNHRLQTLIDFLGLEKGAAHRALDDAKACLEVGLHCFEKMESETGRSVSFNEIEKKQGHVITWPRFSMNSLRKDLVIAEVVKATEERKKLSLIYGGGKKGKVPRQVSPMGLVRSLDGDYLAAFCDIDQKKKRFYLNKIIEAEAL